MRSSAIMMAAPAINPMRNNTALRKNSILQPLSDSAPFQIGRKDIRKIIPRHLRLFNGIFVISHFHQNVMIRYVLIEFIFFLDDLSRKTRI